MKKRNPGGGDLTRKAAAKARRKRRQAKLASAVADRTKWLFTRLGTVQQELLNAQARINELQQRLAEAPSDSAQG